METVAGVNSIAVDRMDLACALFSSEQMNIYTCNIRTYD